MAKPYNGHHCWNCWNVALWISNDEGLYNLALECKRQYKGWQATKHFLAWVPKTTPDGAKYTPKAVAAALRGLE